ncbi:trypsin-like peptidase domain-containing protein [Streptomyces sp. NPDC015130]|uniref:trypsin-like peptidase domain-containing protein n=1 Tax=Streptomyces sp. NPDC015130 TaxID=3364940 RepID=UPI0036FEA469
MGRGDLATLVEIRDPAGRPRGTGFLADHHGTVVTSHEAVDGLARLVLHAPGDLTWLAEAEAVTPLPESGLALVRTEGLGIRPVALATRPEIEPGTYVRIAAHGWREARVLGPAAVTYAAADRFHLLADALELAIGTEGAEALRRGGRAAGGPVLDTATGTVVAVLGTALHGRRPAAGYAVPLRPDGPLAALLRRNAATVPAYGPDLNLAGILELTATSTGPAREPDPWPEPVERPECAREFARFTAGEAPVLALVGAPGTGRTTALAALCARRSQGAAPAPTVRLRGADLRAEDRSLADAVGRALRQAGRIVAAAGALGDTATATPERAAALARDAGRPLLVVLDGPEEMPPLLAHRLADWTGATERWLRDHGARLVTACRPEHWDLAGALYGPGALHRPAQGNGDDLPAALVLGPYTETEARAVGQGYGIGETDLAEADARHPLALRLLAEVRAALPGEVPGRPGREEIFTAHVDLMCLRVAVRVAAGSRPLPRGTAVRLLAARVAGQVHEAARRCLGPGHGVLDRASFEELFPWREGWASAVLTEGLLVPAGSGYRFAHEELADWLQAAHLDLDTALHALVHSSVPPTPARSRAEAGGTAATADLAGRATAMDPAVGAGFAPGPGATPGPGSTTWHEQDDSGRGQEPGRDGQPGRGQEPVRGGEPGRDPVRGREPGRGQGPGRGSASARGAGAWAGAGSDVPPCGGPDSGGPPDGGPGGGSGTPSGSASGPGAAAWGGASPAGASDGALVPLTGQPGAVPPARPSDEDPVPPAPTGRRRARRARREPAAPVARSGAEVPRQRTPATGEPAAEHLPVPRHRIGPVLQALLRLHREQGPGALAPRLAALVESLDRFADAGARGGDRTGAPHPYADAVWWAVRLLGETARRVPDPRPYLPVLRLLADRIGGRPAPHPVFAGFGVAFWQGLPLGEDERIDLLRRLVPADPPQAGTPGGDGDRSLDAVAALLVADPRGVQPLLCRWFGDERPLPAAPHATVATAAQALLHTHRGLAVDDLCEALVSTAHPLADGLLAALAEDEPSALCRAVDRWAHDDGRPERRVAAAAYGQLVADRLTAPADRELLRYAALALLARPGDQALHGPALGLLVRDPHTRARHLPRAIAEPRVPAAALAEALATHPGPVLTAFRSRLHGTGEEAAGALRALAEIDTPALTRRVAALVRDYVARLPEGAAHVAGYVDRRFEDGPAARAVLFPLVSGLIRGRPAVVRRALAPVLAAPGTGASRHLRAELLDVLLDHERYEAEAGELSVLDALLTAAAEGAGLRSEPRTRELVHRAAALYTRTPEGAGRLDRVLAGLAGERPGFAGLLVVWTVAVPGEWAPLLGPETLRVLRSPGTSMPMRTDGRGHGSLRPA